MDIDVSKEDNFQIVPTINQLPDSTINFHYNLPNSGVQNYVLYVNPCFPDSYVAESTGSPIRITKHLKHPEKGNHM